jgi:hypothetical protein
MAVRLNKLTSLIRLRLQKVVVAQLLMKFLALYANQDVITAFTSGCYLALSSTSFIQAIPRILPDFFQID